MTNTPPYFKKTVKTASSRSSSEASASPNWWYGTALRYLTGTLMGVLCLCVIGTAFRNHAVLESMKSFTNPQSQGNVVAGICVLLSGLLFCYISSSPITIFHAARMFKPEKMYGQWLVPSRVWRFVGISGFVLFPLMFFTKCEQFETAFAMWLSIPALYVLFFQWCCICSIEKSTKQGLKDDVFSEYVINISNKRQGYKDFRESYSHLREHSNSIFIVLLEISLSAVLWLVVSNANSPRLGFLLMGGFVFMWLLPTVFLWSFANHLEGKLETFN